MADMRGGLRSRRIARIWHLVAAAWLGALLACARGAPSTGSAQDGSSASTLALEPYPRGRWRLADDMALDRALVWVSHIEIRHELVSDAHASFTLMPWTVGEPPPHRSRAEALELAREVADKARARPNTFAALAERYSEDVTTRSFGGFLGGLTAAHFSSPTQVLDAIATLQPGDVSRVVETEEGYHVFYRHAPPTERNVSGARLVIAYVGADGLAMRELSPKPRSRAAASELAATLYRTARATPSTFPELVKRYTELPGTHPSGDFGSWSTRQRSVLAREIALLGRLQVGEIAPPLDSPWGFEIIQRTPERARLTLAMDPIEIVFDPGAPDGTQASRSWALERALELARRLQREPDLFSTLKLEYGIAALHRGPERWVEGQDELGRLTQAVRALEIGEIAAQPVEDLCSFILPKRIDPAEAPSPMVSLDVPAPETIDREYLARTAADDPAFYRMHLTPIVRRALIEHVFTREEMALVDGFIDEVAGLHGATERLARYQELDRQLRSALGPERYAQYVSIEANYFEQLFL